MPESNNHAEKLPDFLIVGAAKSGTTSLYHYLKQHPDVFMPDWKEPSFFAPPEAGGMTDENEYRKLFSEASHKNISGEASVAYLYIPDAPQKIYEFLGPDTKIIILLRNPVDMAHSLWGHMRRLGAEPLSFRNALQKESDRKAENSASKRYHDEWLGNFLYKERATYMPQIHRYLSRFEKNNIRIYIFEEFFAPGLPLIKDLYHFLGINDEYVPAEKVYNVAGTVKSTSLQNIIRHDSLLKTVAKKILPTNIRQVIRKKVEETNRVEKPLPPVASDLRAQLMKEFDEDVRALEKLLDRSLKEVWF